MARKDDVLKSFLNHDILKDKYGLTKEEFPQSVREGLISEELIVKAISLIVEGLDGTSPVTDSVLRNQVTQFLNEAL